MDPSSKDTGRDPRLSALFWRRVRRQALVYFLPLLLLAGFFHLQYGRLAREGTRAHLGVIAEHQAATLDLFLRERVADLTHALDGEGNEQADLERALERLRQVSDAFVDLGQVDSGGLLERYAGPVQYDGLVSYAAEGWFQDLTGSGASWTVTDIYPGLRGEPHFTLAVRRGAGVVRAALSPEKLRHFLRTLEGAAEVRAAVVNRNGQVQVSTAAPRVKPAAAGPRPPATPQRGTLQSGGAYAWLQGTTWALVVESATPAAGALAGLLEGVPLAAPLLSVPFFLLMGLIIAVRAHQEAAREVEAYRQKEALSGKLIQAAKLASVGELAAGIAHEINNPLAIIAEEAGIMRDSLDPDLSLEEEEELNHAEHLDAIHDAVFRCRDITRKLLTFVRQDEVRLALVRADELVDEVIDMMMAPEIHRAGAAVKRDHQPGLAPLLADRTLLGQVLVNLVRNALDAMEGGGTLSARTSRRGDRLAITIADTGCGMGPEELEKISTPFYTTKAPGKGTGLGLSVSFSIVRSLGGELYVQSAPGRGSSFTVLLPAHQQGA